MTNKPLKQLQSRLNTVIKGKENEVKNVLVCLIAGGHLLIEDVPGVGKTTMAFALAKATDCSFGRIQFTSDLMPSDITGISVFNQEKREFEFRPGPIFSNIVLADEINRTNPKTQSALLEAMNERKVTVDRRTFALPRPFMVVATQNPMEHHGTFPLPESQLDRFMMQIRIGYPDPEHEKAVLYDSSGVDEIEKMPPVVSKAEILEMQAEARGVKIEESLMDFLLEIVSATRAHEKIRLGVSTRGAQFFLRAAKAHSWYEGRTFVLPDDVRKLAVPVLSHRIIPRSGKYEADASSLISEILERVSVPV